jgi:hypothetical protein
MVARGATVAMLKLVAQSRFQLPPFKRQMSSQIVAMEVQVELAAMVLPFKLLYRSMVAMEEMVATAATTPTVVSYSSPQKAKLLRISQF